MSKRFLLASLLLILAMNGCASSKDTLQLENIVEAEAQRKARLAEEAAKEKAAVEKQAQMEAAAKPASSNLGKTPQEIIAKAKARPEELEFLEIPESMVRLSSQETAEPKMKEKINRTFPDLIAGWRDQNSDVMILAGLILMRPDHLADMTKEQFKESIQKVKTKYEYFYNKQYKAPLSFEVFEKGAMIYVRMTSKYLDGSDWRTDERFIYFYKPDYRLNLLVTGKEADLAKLKPQTDEMIKIFENRLTQYFREGIQFRKE